MSRSFKKEFLPATQATNASFFSLNRSEISLQMTILIPSHSLVIFPDDLHRLRYQYSNAIWAHVQASAVAGGRFDCLLKSLHTAMVTSLRTYEAACYLY